MLLSKWWAVFKYLHGCKSNDTPRHVPKKVNDLTRVSETDRIRNGSSTGRVVNGSCRGVLELRTLHVAATLSHTRWTALRVYQKYSDLKSEDIFLTGTFY